MRRIPLLQNNYHNLSIIPFDKLATDLQLTCKLVASLGKRHPIRFLKIRERIDDFAQKRCVVEKNDNFLDKRDKRRKVFKEKA